MALEHTAYLEAHHELTDAALTDIAEMMGRDDFEAARDKVTTTRQATDALWEQRRQGLGES
jgi:hypothetical protein